MHYHNEKALSHPLIISCSFSVYMALEIRANLIAHIVNEEWDGERPTKKYKQNHVIIYLLIRSL